MQRTLIYAKNPTWANRSHTKIDVIVKFYEIPEEIPFTADPNDSEEHGRDIYQRALAEEFGPVAEFQPVPFTLEEVVGAVKLERDYRLEQTDWTQLPDVSQETKSLWEPYRQALRDLPQQPDFPWYSQVLVEDDCGFLIDFSNVPWPTRPTL